MERWKRDAEEGEEVNWRVGLSFVERRVAYKPEICRLDVQEDWRWKGLLA